MLFSLGGYGLFLILSILGAVGYVSHSIQRFDTSLQKFDQLVQSLEDVHEAYLYQAKDQKNLFLRGQDQTEFGLYWQRIEHFTSKINAQIEQVLTNPLSHPYRPTINQLIADHTQLMQLYQQSTNVFQTTQDPRISDQVIRDQGSNLDEALRQVIRQVQGDRTAFVNQEKKQLQQFLLISASILILLILIWSGLLAIVITSPIRRILRFTRFLEDRRQAKQAQQAESTLGLPHQARSMTSQLDSISPSVGMYRQDEIGYMLTTYSQLSEIVDTYNQQLQARDGLLNCVNAATQCLVANDQLEMALPTMLQILGEGTQQCRAYILTLSPDQSNKELMFHLSLEWDAPGIPPKQQTGGQFPVPVNRFPPRLVAPLRAGQATQFLARELDGIRPSERKMGQARSLVGVPITVHGEWWGLLGLDDCVTERLWSEAEITVLATAATAVGNAVERDQNRQAREAAEKAVLTEREQAACERAAELAKTNEAIGQILDTLMAKPDLEELLDEILPQMTEHTCAHATHIFLYDELTESLDLHIACIEEQVYAGPTPTDPDFFATPILANSSALWTAIMHSPKPITFDDQHLENTALLCPELRAWYRRQRYTSATCVRMRVGEQSIGFIDFVFRDRKHIDDEQLEFIQALTHQATLAVHLTRLAKQSQTAALIEERNRLAREIHDTLAQAFTGVSLQLEAAKGVLVRNPELAQTYIQRAGTLTRQGLSEARRSVHALRSQILEADELPEALPKTLAEMTRDTPLQAHFNLIGQAVPLSDDLQLNLLRIGQEAITNTIRHAQARIISLTLRYEPGNLRLQIVDDGIGFNIDTLVDVTGFGLIGMRERASRFDGQLRVISQPGHGTSIDVSIPMDPSTF